MDTDLHLKVRDNDIRTQSHKIGLNLARGFERALRDPPAGSGVEPRKL